MVVHLSAGISSFVLAQVLGESDYNHDESNKIMLLIGMIFITFGWFGFNTGPVGRWNQQSAYIFLKTFLAVISGGLSWVLGAQFVPNSERTERLLNGVIVGFVTSTAGIGYLTSIQVAVLTFIASICTFVLSQWVSDIIPIDDVVTSFGINGIGGFLGSLGVVLFHFNHFFIQLLAIFITCLLSISMTYLITTFTFKACGTITVKN